MPVKIVQRDLMQAPENIIGHQVNCYGVMGSGVAAQIKSRYRNAYEAYIEKCDSTPPIHLLGDCQIINVGDDKFVANMFGQMDYGRGLKRYTDYDALTSALYRVRDFASVPGYTVALPYNIGCGLANGDWEVVEPMIQQVFSDYEVTLYQIQ